jgi:hypothetical protein
MVKRSILKVLQSLIVHLQSKDLRILQMLKLVLKKVEKRVKLAMKKVEMKVVEMNPLEMKMKKKIKKNRLHQLQHLV